MGAKFFKDQAAFRKWLEANHAKKSELIVGFYKKASGKKSITYHEALDEALCFGWIDGVKHKLDEDSYSHRFTPRSAKSVWSNVNIKHVERLKQSNLMAPAGLAAYEKRDPKRTGIYSFENQPRELAAEFARQFRANEKAWEFFGKQPPGYKRLATFWIMSAKKEETRGRRLQQLIETSAQEQRLAALSGSAVKNRGGTKSAKKS